MPVKNIPLLIYRGVRTHPDKAPQARRSLERAFGGSRHTAANRRLQAKRLTKESLSGCSLQLATVIRARPRPER